MKISVTSNIKKVTHSMRNVRKQLPFATSKAINKTLTRVKDAEMTEIVRKIDRPKPETVEAFWIDRSDYRKKKMYGSVSLKDRNQYLTGLITGGTELKPRPVPGRQAKLDLYGNLPRRATKAKRTFNATTRRGLSGVWKRTGRGKNAKVHLVGHYPNARNYRPRLDFYGVAGRTTRNHFEREMRRAITYALRTAK